MVTAGHKLNIFLCHASVDKDRVRPLYRQLLNSGFAPWFDEVSLLPGQDWRQVIDQAIRGSDVVVVCLSNASIGKKGFVQTEIRVALDVADEQPEGKIFIIPTKLEECPAPARLSRLHYVELYKPEGFHNLLRALYSESNSRGLPIPSSAPLTETRLLYNVDFSHFKPYEVFKNKSYAYDSSSREWTIELRHIAREGTTFLRMPLGDFDARLEARLVSG